MYISFCFLKEIPKTRNRGIYGSVLIKNRRYFPRGVNGYVINEYFSFINGDMGCLRGEWYKI